jgi:hypothetical protein
MNNGRVGSFQQLGAPQDYGLQHISPVPVRMRAIALLYELRHGFFGTQQIVLNLAFFSNIAAD